MSFKDKLKNAVASTGIVEFDETSDASTTGEHAAIPTARSMPISVVPMTSMVNQSATMPDQSIVDELNAAANASKRLEYAAFLKAQDSLKGMPDTQRTMMALSVLQGMQGIAPQDVVAALDDRIALVDGEATGFEKAYQASVTNAVTNVQNQIADIEKQVEAKKAEIDALQNKRITLKQQAGDAQVKLESERSTFLASHNLVRSALQNERERIITNLPK